MDRPSRTEALALLAGTAVRAGTSPIYITGAPDGLWVVNFTAEDLLHRTPASRH